MPLTLQISDKEQIKVTLAPDGPVDGIPVWSVVSGGSTVTPDANGMSAVLVSLDNAPTGGDDTVYEVSADVNMGTGITHLTDQVQLHVTEAQATSLGLSAASPEPK